MITCFPGCCSGRGGGGRELTVTRGTLQLVCPAPQEQGLAGTVQWRGGPALAPAPLEALLGEALTDPLLQVGGSRGLGGPGLALLQGAALVVHAAALELAQQIKEALLVSGWGPRDTLGAGVGAVSTSSAQLNWPCCGQQPLTDPCTRVGGLLGLGKGQDPHLPPAGHPTPNLLPLWPVATCACCPFLLSPAPPPSLSSLGCHPHAGLHHPPRTGHCPSPGHPHPATVTPTCLAGNTSPQHPLPPVQCHHHLPAGLCQALVSAPCNERHLSLGTSGALAPSTALTSACRMNKHA